MNTNEDMMSLNVDHAHPAGLFGCDDDIEPIVALCMGFIKEGDAQHDTFCKRDAECHGENPYILAQLKAHLVVHGEYDQMYILALVSTLFYVMGKRDAEMMAKLRDKNDELRELEGLANFLKGMRGEGKDLMDRLDDELRLDRDKDDK